MHHYYHYHHTDGDGDEYEDEFIATFLLMVTLLNMTMIFIATLQRENWISTLDHASGRHK